MTNGVARPVRHLLLRGICGEGAGARRQPGPDARQNESIGNLAALREYWFCLTEPFVPIQGVLLACRGGINLPPHIAVLIIGWLVALILCPVNLGLILLTLKKKILLLAHGTLFLLAIGLADFLMNYVSSRKHDFNSPDESMGYAIGYAIPILVIGQFVALLRFWLKERKKNKSAEEGQPG